MTEFVECLYVNYDFDRAQKKLLECDKVLVQSKTHSLISCVCCCVAVRHTQVLENDFFLIACREDFIESARLSIFETFCRIHQCISIRYEYCDHS